MKSSRYNRIIELSDKEILTFNALSTDLSIADSRFIKILENLDTIDFDQLSESEKDVYKKMEQGGYIIDDDIDELKIIELRNLRGRFSEDVTTLTIAPTLDCNFNCSYCFEERQQGTMSNEVIESIYSLVTSEVKKRQMIKVTWFGGEPTLEFELIKKMSKKLIEICESNDVSYDASMVSNGYLFDEQTVLSCLENKISHIQITIDGPPSIHNSRRCLRNGEATFNKIIESLKLFKKHGISSNIRVNLDKNNIEDIDELFNVLERHELMTIPIDFGHVKIYNRACSSLDNKCISQQEYSVVYREFNKKLKNCGFITPSLYPSSKGNYCGADRVNSHIIDPKGNMYRCWNEIGYRSKVTGHILDQDRNDNMSHALEYATYSPLKKEKCITCDILPICMGGCVYESISNSEPSCEKWKFGLDEYLKETYYDILEKKQLQE